jgi:hypothetical protein
MMFLLELRVGYLRIPGEELKELSMSLFRWVYLRIQYPTNSASALTK